MYVKLSTFIIIMKCNLESNTKLNILTIDCEDFFSLPAFNNKSSSKDWDKMIDRQVDIILKKLEENDNTKATFFIVGNIAERNPQVVKKIISKGHHIGSHFNNHKAISELNKKEFEKNLEDSLSILKKISGMSVNTFRAPFWSYSDSLYWYWDILKKKQIKYDSSIFPINKYLFGTPGAKRFIHRKDHEIIEIPPSTIKIFGLNIPFSGGVYFRALPFFIIKRFIKRLQKKEKSIIMYFHPWELDPELVRVKGIRLIDRIVLYYNNRNALKKFEKLIKEWHFTSIETYMLKKAY